MVFKRVELAALIAVLVARRVAISTLARLITRDADGGDIDDQEDRYRCEKAWP
jgi:hypothetical protein